VSQARDAGHRGEAVLVRRPAGRDNRGARTLTVRGSLVEKLFIFFGHRHIKRIMALLVFVGAVVLLRHLATLLVFYLVFSHGLGYLAGKLSSWTRLGEKVWVVLLIVVLLGGLGSAIYAGVHRSLPTLTRLTHSAPDRVQAFKETDFYQMVESHVDLDKYEEQIQHFSQSLMRLARATGRTLLHLILALILAVLYLFERKEVDEIYARVSPDTFLGTLIALFRFTSEAVLLTIKVQVIVAAVNAAITLPILFGLHLPHIPTLMLMVFAFGLVPVVGNFLSGVVLAILSYLKMGFFGVGIFLASTFILHKIESYYLNPRLTAQHVKLPSLLLIASLIIWEHLIGIAGIFVSFPVLYIGLRTRDLFRSQDSATPAAVTVTSVHSTPDPSSEL
jgi:predicted PurR-regulated permease PerM